MILPPVTPDYKSSSQAILTKADEQNFKLDRDNFFTTGSICLQSDNGKWWQITISDSGVLGTSELTTSDGRLDSDGNPVIASVNPYYTS